jgi:hypothetical protein
MMNAWHLSAALGLPLDLSVMTGWYPHGGIVQQRPEAESVVQSGATIHVVFGPALQRRS